MIAQHIFVMKKYHIYCAFTALLLMTTMASCFGSPSLKEFVSATSHELPIDQGGGVTMTGIKIDGDYLVFTMSQAGLDKQRLLHDTKDIDTQEMFKQCIREGKGVKFATPDTVFLELSPEEMKAEFPGTDPS